MGEYSRKNLTPNNAKQRSAKVEECTMLMQQNMHTKTIQD